MTTPATRFNYRHQYDDARDAQEAALCAIDCTGDEGKTIQSYTEDADLNVIARRYGLLEKPIPHAQLDLSYFADWSNAPKTLSEAMDITRSAANAFNSLPAATRAYFHNDPNELWEFVHDDKNYEKAQELGFVIPGPAATTDDLLKELKELKAAAQQQSQASTVAK